MGKTGWEREKKLYFLGPVVLIASVYTTVWDLNHQIKISANVLVPLLRFNVILAEIMVLNKLRLGISLKQNGPQSCEGHALAKRTKC
jgi:hypothetical protein